MCFCFVLCTSSRSSSCCRCRYYYYSTTISIAIHIIILAATVVLPRCLCRARLLYFTLLGELINHRWFSSMFRRERVVAIGVRIGERKDSDQNRIRNSDRYATTKFKSERAHYIRKRFRNIYITWQSLYYIYSFYHWTFLLET